MDRAATSAPQPARPAGLLAGMRIRKKLMVLHTCFSLGLALILLVLLQPAISDVVSRAERAEARMLVRAISPVAAPSPGEEGSGDGLPRLPANEPGVELLRGGAIELGMTDEVARLVDAAQGQPVDVPRGDDTAASAALVGLDAEGRGVYAMARVRITESRRAVVRLYTLLVVALVAVYALVAAALEVFVLPAHVYGPIRRILDADRAVQEGRKREEIIPDSGIPLDELGEIMRSRNRSIQSLRRHELDLAQALARLEEVATDLARKNHLLQTAQRNLADADRLASLGMMSAGIAHELNTPLTVLKGLVERLNANPGAGMDAESAALMLRVLRRLERLGESLLDYARARPSASAPASLRPLVEEAATLVRLDRDARDVQVVNSVSESLVVECDADRIVQVLVNLLRNAVDAVRTRRERSGSDGSSPRVSIAADIRSREGAEWVSITITDTGPGIDPEIIPTLFQPFASTRLDARGTGLGLAVSESIVRDHGGLILARNRADGRGAVFEIMMPRVAGGGAQAAAVAASR